MRGRLPRDHEEHEEDARPDLQRPATGQDARGMRARATRPRGDGRTRVRTVRSRRGQQRAHLALLHPAATSSWYMRTAPSERPQRGRTGTPSRTSSGTTGTSRPRPCGRAGDRCRRGRRCSPCRSPTGCTPPPAMSKAGSCIRGSPVLQHVLEVVHAAAPTRRSGWPRSPGRRSPRPSRLARRTGPASTPRSCRSASMSRRSSDVSSIRSSGPSDGPGLARVSRGITPPSVLDEPEGLVRLGVRVPCPPVPPSRVVPHPGAAASHRPSTRAGPGTRSSCRSCR